MNESSSSMERDLGRLEARMAALEADVSIMVSDLRQIRATLQAVRGGWIMLGLIITASSGLGALAAKLWPVVTR